MPTSSLYCCVIMYLAVIRCQFSELNKVLSKLPFEDSDRAFSLAVGLCVSHTRQAFSEGVQVGMRLFTELAG